MLLCWCLWNGFRWNLVVTLHKLLFQAMRSCEEVGPAGRGGVLRVMSQRGRGVWRNSGISRKGGEGEREGEREKGSSPISFCVYLSKVTFTKQRNDWRPCRDQHAEERDLKARTDSGLSAVVHSWWQHQILTLSKALGLEWLQRGKQVTLPPQKIEHVGWMDAYLLSHSCNVFLLVNGWFPEKQKCLVSEFSGV